MLSRVESIPEELRHNAAEIESDRRLSLSHWQPACWDAWLKSILIPELKLISRLVSRAVERTLLQRLALISHTY